MRQSAFLPVCALALLSACKTASTAVDGVKSAGSAVAESVGGVTTSLVNVNLSNVLNDLALKLNIERANIPINAQIPISLAANVCGVSINILSIGAGGGSSQGCNAQTASPELVQAVQQQLAANGSVGGGAQTSGTSASATAGGTGSNTTSGGATTSPAGTSPSTQQAPATTTQPSGSTNQ
jgi:hypothetical protein